MKYFFTALCLLMGTCLVAIAEPETGPSVVPGYTVENLLALEEKIHKTGLGTGNIPAIDRPQYMSISDASLAMDDREIVFIVEFPDGTVRIYPRRILVWHEVVNDTLPPSAQTSPEALSPAESNEKSAPKRYTITYSPISGTVTAFTSTAGRFSSSFAVTGDLLYGNSLLYDRVSHSVWSQLLAASIKGPLQNKRLERLPVLWATWGGVKKRYQNKAEVLSSATGYKRTYGKDPYGSYTRENTFYTNTRMPAGMGRQNNRLPPKTHILGIEHDAVYGAISWQVAKKKRLVNFTLGLTPMVGLYDAGIDAVRIFERRVLGTESTALPLEFDILEDDSFIEKAKSSKWSAEGTCLSGVYHGQRLIPVITIDSMWMSWSALHPRTQIVPEQ